MKVIYVLVGILGRVVLYLIYLYYGIFKLTNDDHKSKFDY